MNVERIDDAVARVNAFVARNLWMDFSVWSYEGVNLTIAGSIDEPWWVNLRVIFRSVCWASIRYQGWKSDTSRPVLLRVDGVEAYSMNVRFEIEQGHHLFKFVPDDFREPMWIAAQEIEVDFTRLDLPVKRATST